MMYTTQPLSPPTKSLQVLEDDATNTRILRYELILGKIRHMISIREGHDILVYWLFRPLTGISILPIAL